MPSTTIFNMDIIDESVNAASEESPSIAESATTASTADCQKHQWYRPHHRPRVNTHVSMKSTLNAIFSPRPSAALFVEWEYLVKILRQHNERKTKLMHEYSLLEAQFLAAVGKTRRKLSKRLRLLRCDMEQSVNQIVASYLHLVELSVEMQSHETWSQVNCHRNGSMDANAVASAFATYSAISPVYSPVSLVASPAWSVPTAMSTPTTPLNAASVEFFPSSYFSQSHGTSTSPEKNTETQDAETTLEILEECTAEQENDSRPPHADGDSETVLINDEEEYREGILPCGAGIRARERGRRLSMPCLHMAWPDA